MGGIAGALGRLFEKAGDATTDKFLSSDAGTKTFNLIGNKESVFKTHPAGMEVGKLDFAFIQQRNALKQKLDAPVQKLWGAIKADPALTNAMDYRKSSIQDIHSHLQGQAHPAAQHTDAILNQNIHAGTGQSHNADVTLHGMGLQNKLQSNLEASANVFGPHMENLAPHLMPLFESKDPKDNMLGQTLADIISNETHDTFEMNRTPASKVKFELGKTFETENKFRKLLGGTGKEVKLPNNEPTYKAPGKIESKVQSWYVNRLASLAFLPHLTMFANLSSAPMAALWGGLKDVNDPQLKQLVETSGILGNTLHAMMQDDLMGRTGTLADKTQMRGASAILYKSFHMPLFNVARFHQLSLAAAVGYHSAIMWGTEAISGNRRALAELAEMGLDPQRVIANKGQLSDDELQKAMFHFVNNRFFIDRPMDRSLYANANPWIRSATLFHGTVSSQFRFMQREMNKMLKAGDIKGIAQFAGTIAVLFPAVAPFLKSAEVLGRTASPQQAGQSIEDDYSALSGQKGVGEFSSTYIDLLSHLGSFGVYNSYLRAAWSDRLGAALVGPVAGSVIRAGQDLGTGLYGSKSGKHNFNPLGRDISELSIPVAGKWIAHKVFPTTAEKRASGSSTTRLRRRKKF